MSAKTRSAGGAGASENRFDPVCPVESPARRGASSLEELFKNARGGSSSAREDSVHDDDSDHLRPVSVCSYPSQYVYPRGHQICTPAAVQFALQCIIHPLEVPPGPDAIDNILTMSNNIVSYNRDRNAARGVNFGTDFMNIEEALSMIWKHLERLGVELQETNVYGVLWAKPSADPASEQEAFELEEGLVADLEQALEGPVEKAAQPFGCSALLLTFQQHTMCVLRHSQKQVEALQGAPRRKKIDLVPKRVANLAMISMGDRPRPHDTDTETSPPQPAAFDPCWYIYDPAREKLRAYPDPKRCALAIASRASDPSETPYFGTILRGRLRKGG